MTSPYLDSFVYSFYNSYLHIWFNGLFTVRVRAVNKPNQSCVDSVSVDKYCNLAILRPQTAMKRSLLMNDSSI